MSNSFTLNQRILALEAAVTAMEYPDVPKDIQAACDILWEQLNNHIDEHYPSSTSFSALVRDQRIAVAALNSHPESWGGAC